MTSPLARKVRRGRHEPRARYLEAPSGSRPPLTRGRLRRLQRRVDHDRLDGRHELDGLDGLDDLDELDELDDLDDGRRVDFRAASEARRGERFRGSCEERNLDGADLRDHR